MAISGLQGVNVLVTHEPKNLSDATLKNPIGLTGVPKIKQVLIKGKIEPVKIFLTLLQFLFR